ncbi:MAG: U32 family peptidase [Treponema sp.]|jgi:putative protease|nr:U32 family peptidase [Treponema sp.]
MELLAPAGNVDKLYYAYAYGADAAYIGLKKFSLRVKADNFYDDEYRAVTELKKKFPGRRLHCALNISFHNRDIEHLKDSMEYFRQYPVDAFIVQDLGIVPLLQKNFPEAALHLSTQASCINSEAVKMYKSLGFSRIVLGRETSLAEIRQIKDAVPDMELEAFCHGAMCIAYSGRCLMSAYMNGRSAQAGLCSHSCRWNYDVLVDGKKISESIAQSGALVLREQSRPDELYPVFEGDDFTAVLSSKDLCMIDHLADMKAAGLDSVKIEGRMKSVYYVALVTLAYRKALDVLDGKISPEAAAPFIAELDNVSHRECSTGFYYSRTDADKTTAGASDSPYLLAAEIGDILPEDAARKIFAAGEKTVRDREADVAHLHPAAAAARRRDWEKHPERAPAAATAACRWNLYHITPLNKISTGMTLEFISPERAPVTAPAGTWSLVDPVSGTQRLWGCGGHDFLLYTRFSLSPGTLVRIHDPDYIPGTIRDPGR